MHIANPWYLILLIAPPFLLYYYLRWGRAKTPAISFSQVDAAKKAMPYRIDYFKLIPKILRILALTFLILGLIRFQHGIVSRETSFSGIDIIICLDTSPSMKALDFNPKNRITVAKEVVKEFIKRRGFDRIGMVVFAGSSLTVCPLTSDHFALLQHLDKVEEGITKTDGTAIGVGLATSINRLKESTAKSKVIILVTDGRSNLGMIDPLSAAKLAKAMGIKIYAVGVGKKGPAPFPIEHPLYGTILRYIDEDLDEDTLKEIASTTSGIYERAVDPESLKSIFDTIDKMEKTEFKIKTHVNYRESYQLFLCCALFLLILESVLWGTVFRRIP